MANEEQSQDPRLSVAFPPLSPEQIESLRPFGREVHIPAGQPVWEAGQANLCMFVVLKGTMRIEEPLKKKYIASHKEGHFSGDIDVISGRASVVNGVAETDLDLLEIPGDCVKNIVGEQPRLGSLILSAFLMRRAILRELEIGMLVFGSRYSPDTLRIREFLSRNRYPYHWEDLESSQETGALLREFQVTEDETPVVVLPSGQVLNRPDNATLAEALGITRPIEDKTYDLVIIGAGPAGLAAAVYGASEGLSTLVIDDNGPGGQAGTSSRIENYMGFPTGLTGQDLADRAVAQAERFGAQLLIPGVVTSLTCNKYGHEVVLENRDNIVAKCVLLAMGAKYRQLQIDGMERFEGRGIYYSATNVERILCGDEAVAVVGAGNSAGQAAVFMAENAKHVFLIVRGDDLGKSMSSYLARRIDQSSKISVLLNSEICELRGKDAVEEAQIVDRKTGKERVEKLSAVFVMIGAVPNTAWLPKQLVCEEKGFVLTGQQVVENGTWKEKRHPYYLETSCPGVFAAGDVRSESVKRVASAVGEGSMAVAFVHQYLAQV